jgi:hypothetical protein
MSARTVRAQIRERIRSGTLPGEPNAKVYAGRGTQATCACCGGTIALHETEYEVPLNSISRTYHVHVDCYCVWLEELRP